MRYEVAQIGDGWTGTEQTVGRIQQLVEDSLTDPVVVRAARAIVSNVPERDKEGEIRAVSNFVRSKIRYVSEGIETLSTPRLMLDDIEKHGKASGDCDEFVTLWLSLLRVLGHEVRVKTVSQRKDGLANHIYGQVFSRGRWVTDDTIVKRKPLGWEPPSKNVTNSRVFNMSGGIGSLGHCGSCPKEMNMASMQDWMQIGRTRILSEGDVAKQGVRRTPMSSRSLAPSSVSFKKTGMLFVAPGGRASTVNGLGLDIFSGIVDIVSSGISAGGKLLESRTVASAQQRIAALTLPGTLPSIAPAPTSSAPAINPMFIVGGIGLVALIMFMKK